MSIYMRFPRRFPLPLFLVFAFLFVSSCDSTTNGGSNAVTLTASVAQGDIPALTFQFAADDIQTGRLVDLDATNAIDISAFLRDRGFDRSEIVSAEISAASFEVIFPITETVSFLDTAILKLTGANISDTEVAEQSTFPSGNVDEATLTVRPNRDITSFLSQSDFSAILQIDANALRSGEDYEIAVSLTLSIEVEGF